MNICGPRKRRLISTNSDRTKETFTSDNAWSKRTTNKSTQLRQTKTSSRIRKCLKLKTNSIWCSEITCLQRIEELSWPSLRWDSAIDLSRSRNLDLLCHYNIRESTALPRCLKIYSKLWLITLKLWKMILVLRMMRRSFQNTKTNPSNTF